jgi:hypothetical protein
MTFAGNPRIGQKKKKRVWFGFLGFAAYDVVV